MDLTNISLRFGTGNSEFPMYKGSFTYLHETWWEEWKEAALVPFLNLNGIEKCFLLSRGLHWDKKKGQLLLPKGEEGFTLNRLEIRIEGGEPSGVDVG